MSFDLALVLDPLQHFPQDTHSIKLAATLENFVPMIHWFHSYDLVQAIENQQLAEKKLLKRDGSSIHIRSNKRLLEAMRDYPDIVFSVSLDGSIIFWGIQVIAS